MKTKQKYNNTRTLYTRLDISTINEELKSNPPYEVQERDLARSSSVPSTNNGRLYPSALSFGTPSHSTSNSKLWWIFMSYQKKSLYLIILFIHSFIPSKRILSFQLKHRLLFCLMLWSYYFQEIPHQTGTNNRGLKPMFSENHKIWHRGSYCKVKKNCQIWAL